MDGRTASGACTMDYIRADTSSTATISTTIFAHTLEIEWLSRTKAISEYTSVSPSPLNSVTSQPIENRFAPFLKFIIASIMVWHQNKKISLLCSLFIIR